ncbi:hypothetical protein [Geoalkalibacter sp.]|uniref:hypothetical protein n=1 Tax=Geoalkalibacter sp. TaxID=3041440 RepID=UPI00272E166A|nr:hypothetical protein [Geoalkalibacter sp.]
MTQKKTRSLWPWGLLLLFLVFFGFSGWSIYTAGTRVSPVVEGYGQSTPPTRSLNQPQ